MFIVRNWSILPLRKMFNFLQKRAIGSKFVEGWLKLTVKYFAEEPQPTDHCPRKHGYFGHEESRICDKFYYCVDGMFNMITCPNGLVYNDKVGICSWPDEAKKKGCSSEGQYIQRQILPVRKWILLIARLTAYLDKI